MPTSDSPSDGAAGAGDDLVYFNGIDGETGQYAVNPRTIDQLAELARANPRTALIAAVRSETDIRAFGLPPGVEHDEFDTTGWGVIFSETVSPDIRAALEPLFALRRRQTGALFKTLDYKAGEQTRDWYRRHGIAPSQLNPDVVPYYLMIVGPPEEIPFEFQYLLGVDYAVGRLSFGSVDEYARYAESVVRYEGADSLANAKTVAYWGTRHVGDKATQLSASQLISSLANGDPNAAGRLAKPAHADFKFSAELSLANDATKQALLAKLTAEHPPALLFTASHGMQFGAGRPVQPTAQGALLCQDWPGFGTIAPDHYLAASDVSDDANVNGMVAFFFACFGGGTPKVDQFFLNPEQLAAGAALPPLAPQPFMAALPRRLLAHPKGSALAVVAHVDRAWGYSIQAPGMQGGQITPFRSSLQFMMKGQSIGHVVRDQFASRFSVLSAELLSLLAPGAPKPSDRDLVVGWLERNDAQNYVVLGDPAVRIRVDKLV
jgi:hypothetical protein